MRLELVAEIEAHKENVWNLSWSHDGKTLASCGSDKTVRIWTCPFLVQNEPNNFKFTCIDTLDNVHSRTVRAVDFSTADNLLACASFDGTCSVWMKRGEETSHPKFKHVNSLEGHENEVKSVSWEKTGTNTHLLATCSRDKTVWIWEMMDEQGAEFDCVTVLNGHSQDVKQVKWHPTREMLASASYDDTIRIWVEESDDWTCGDVLTGHKSTVWGMAFNSDGSLLASCSADMSIFIWKIFVRGSSSEDRSVTIPHDKLFVWKCVHKIEQAHERVIYSVDWSPVHHLIASVGGDDVINIFSVEELSATNYTHHLRYQQKQAHQTDINCVKWNPVFGNLLATCSDDSMIKVWRLIE